MALANITQFTVDILVDLTRGYNTSLETSRYAATRTTVLNVSHGTTQGATPTVGKSTTQVFQEFICTTQGSNNTTHPQAGEEEEEIFTEVVTSDWFWKVFPPIIFAFGVTGNILTLFVVRRMGVKNQPTLVFITFLAITDCVVLCIGLPNYWISYVFDFSLRGASNVNCKLYLFFIYTSMQYSSWILVGVSVERLIKTYFPFRYRRLFTNKKAVIGLIFTLCLLCLIDGHLLFTNGINEYTEGECGSLNEKQFWFDEKVFVYIDFTFLSALPFLAMLSCNIFIAKTLRKIQVERRTMVRRESRKRANRVSVKMTKMLLVCTSFFLVATAPISVYFILDSYLTPKYEEQNDLRSQARMELAWTISYLLQFTNYSINFYLYTAVNSRFLKELKALMQCQPR